MTSLRSILIFNGFFSRFYLSGRFVIAPNNPIFAPGLDQMKRAMSNSLTQKHNFSGEFHLAIKKQILNR